jgi:hypothetical protein
MDTKVRMEEKTTTSSGTIEARDYLHIDIIIHSHMVQKATKHMIHFVGPQN